jgi:hypothetical protein
VVECQLPKLNVAGSSPVTRFLFTFKNDFWLEIDLFGVHQGVSNNWTDKFPHHRRQAQGQRAPNQHPEGTARDGRSTCKGR